MKSLKYWSWLRPVRVGFGLTTSYFLLLSSTQVNDVDQLYEEHYLKSRDIDGRMFFDGDETVAAPKVEM